MDVVSRSTRSRMMAGIRGKNTRPEHFVRSCLTARGYRYRLHRRDLPGAPDVVMPGRRVAIFVHGCFWHQHAECRYAKLPATNTAFWKDKLNRNVERDQTAVALLREMGWRVLTVWECATRWKPDSKALGERLAAWFDGSEVCGELGACNRGARKVGRQERDNRWRTLDLFCGGGGSSWGAKAAGAEIVRGVDAWDLATRTYESNFGPGCGITLRMEEDTRSAVLGDLGPIDLILASPECTHHTCARGSRPRDEGSRLTANYIVNFADDLQPRWMVLENVVHMRGWQGYSALLEKLRALGYYIREQVLEAADFGVPQKRRRLFLLCDRNRMPQPVVPLLVPSGTVENILDAEGTWQSRPLFTDRRAAGTLARAERAIAKLGRGVPFLIVYYGSDGSGGWQPLDRPIRTLTTLDRFGLVTWQDDVAMLRMLQVSELRRAMGFDGSYVLPHGTRRDRIRLLGNGVCPPVMEAAIRSLTMSAAVQVAAE